jgi:Arc/MetJ-type ribon-helix-helix transcriptional regulator
MKNLRITVRFDEKDRATIENLVQQGKFKNISQVIKAAMKEFLAKPIPA